MAGRGGSAARREGVDSMVDVDDAIVSFSLFLLASIPVGAAARAILSPLSRTHRKERVEDHNRKKELSFKITHSKKERHAK